MSKLVLNDIEAGYLSHTAYNANNALIEAALENTLSRNGTTPNQMGASIDMNSNALLNVSGLTLNGVSVIPTGTTTVNANGMTYLPAGVGAVATTVETKLRETVSIKDFGAVEDGITNDAAAIQLALNTGKSIVVNGPCFLGTANSGNFLTLTANGQCVYFEDGASFIANGTNGVSNTAAMIANTGFSGCYLYNPKFTSNGSVLTSATRDSPYGYGVVPTSANIVGVGIINGYGFKLQNVLQITTNDVTAPNTVTGVHLDYVSDTCFYGFGAGGAGDHVTGSITCIDNHRPIIIYGCHNHDYTVNSHAPNIPTSLLQTASISAGIISGESRDTYSIKVRYVASGADRNVSSSRLQLLVAHFTTGGAPTPVLRDIDIYYDDRAGGVQNGIAFAYYLDGVAQASYTGTAFDRITLRGYMTSTFNMTQGGATAKLAQTVKGYANMEELQVVAGVAVAANPFVSSLFSSGSQANASAFYGLRQFVDGIHFATAGNTGSTLTTYIAGASGDFTPVLKDAATGNAASAATSIGKSTKIGNRCFFTISLININTTGLTAGNTIHITGLPYTVFNNSNLYTPCQVLRSNVSSTDGSMSGLIAPNTTYMTLANDLVAAGGSSAAIVSQITSTTGDLYISGSYETVLA